LEVVAGTTYFITLDSYYDLDGGGSYDFTLEENVCGDGVVSAAEECDDGNTDAGDGCDPQCMTICGDGFVVGDEQCDDGGTATGDGCDDSCQVELYSRCDGASPTSCAPINILVAPAEDDVPDSRSMIELWTGGSVNYLDVRASTPTLAELQSYDCVWTYSNNTYADGAAMGSVLYDYVNSAAGAVVLGIVSHYVPDTGLAGTPITSVGYSPVTTAGSMTYSGAGYSYVGDGTGILFSNVTGLGLNFQDETVALQGSGVSNGTNSTGTILTAYRPDYRVVYVNGTYQPSYSPTGDWERLVANACAAAWVQ
jgi:cysteine-rich repeat protein